MNPLQCCACLWRCRERKVQRWLLWLWHATKTTKRCKDTTFPLIFFLPPSIAPSPFLPSSLPPFLPPSVPLSLPPSLPFSLLSSHLYLQQLSLLSYDNALSLIRFSTQDEENMCFVLRFCASVLANTLAFQRELAIKKQNETFLQIAKNLFSNLSKLWCHMTILALSHDVPWPSHDHHMAITWPSHDWHAMSIFCSAGDLDVLLREIMKEAQSITKAEKYVLS